MHRFTQPLTFRWPHSISSLGSKVHVKAPVYRVPALPPSAGYQGSIGRLALICQLGGVFPALGAVAQSICLHQWAGSAVGLGQQDPAKHQLLAAFYTDSHQLGHIYSTASSPGRLEDLSALSAWIFLFSLVVLFCLLDSPHLPQPVLYVLIYQPVCVPLHLAYFRLYKQVMYAGHECTLSLMLFLDTRLLTIYDGWTT